MENTPSNTSASTLASIKLRRSRKQRMNKRGGKLSMATVLSYGKIGSESEPSVGPFTIGQMTTSSTRTRRSRHMRQQER